MESLVPQLKIKMSTEVKDLFAALSKAQAVMKPAKKNAKNPHFKSEYANLESVFEAIKPIYDQGLCLSQFPAENNTLVTILGHSSGQWLAAEMSMVSTDSRPHAVGSLLSYMRRYSASAICGISTGEDDDGNTVSLSAGSPKKNNQVDMAKSLGESKAFTAERIKEIKVALANSGYDKDKLVAALGSWPPTTDQGWKEAQALTRAKP